MKIKIIRRILLALENILLHRGGNRTMDNETMMQYFEWYMPADGLHWERVAAKAKMLKEIGVTAVWLPPAYKGDEGKYSVGYDVYDTYDLGEFDRKGEVRTKYGTREEYLKAVQALHKAGIQVIADIVINQMTGADATETVMAIETAEDNREQEISEPFEIEAWTKFDFPSRNGKYSSHKWNLENFTGTDWDEKNKKSGIFLFRGKKWNDETDSENVNFDYLMGVNLDMNNPDTIWAILEWGKWYIKTVKPDGLRLDAVKHINFEFYRDWLTVIRRNAGKDLFAVGEYWNGDVNRLIHYIDVVQGNVWPKFPKCRKAGENFEEKIQQAAEKKENADNSDNPSENINSENENPENTENTVSPEKMALGIPIPAAVENPEESDYEELPEQTPRELGLGTAISLFDVPLHFAFYEASKNPEAFDMGGLFENTLVKRRPWNAVTFVDNHDTQPGQSLESFVEPWFKPIAYAMILLRKDGIPCVFYGDYYGIPHDKIEPISALPILMLIRKLCAYDLQKDYFDTRTIVGFTRSGNLEHPDSGLAVVATSRDPGSKYMVIGEDKTRGGQRFYDALGNFDDPVVLDNNNGADFPVRGGSVSVYVSEPIYRVIRTML